jgi:hypothetical protein
MKMLGTLYPAPILVVSFVRKWLLWAPNILRACVYKLDIWMAIHDPGARTVTTSVSPTLVLNVERMDQYLDLFPSTLIAFELIQIFTLMRNLQTAAVAFGCTPCANTWSVGRLAL